MTKSRTPLPLVALSALLLASCSTEGLGSHSPDAATDATSDSASTQFCTYQGTTYPMGESFKVDCNTCTCTQSGVACTLMACGPFTGGSSGTGGTAAAGGRSGAMGGSGGQGGSGAVGGSGGLGGKGGSGGQGGGRGGSATGGSSAGSDAAPQGCLEDGQLYAIGETFKRDCNTCTCLAGGAACTKMACPPPGDAGPDLPSPPDSGQACSYGGRTYAIGETFRMDCNTCNCTARGIACTGLICPRDAGPDLLSSVDATACTLSANLTFGRDGGNAIYWDVNRLTATTFTITRNYTRRANPDGATSATCSPPLPACGSSGAVTVATINADLANADVQAVWALPQDPTPLFGTDPRPADGTVYSIALDDGRKVFVGGQCASPVMSSCRYIPAGLVQLVADLQKLASAMLADPACQSFL